MYPFPYPRPDPDEFDAELVLTGFITEEERISRAYHRIFADALNRGPYRRSRRPRCVG